jgi:superfamily II DNA or RNA helicase
MDEPQYQPRSYPELTIWLSRLVAEPKNRRYAGEDIFEEYVAIYWRSRGYEVKRNGQILASFKKKHGLPPRGAGIDGILKMPWETEWHPYQVKFTSNDSLKDDRLATFYKHVPGLISRGLAAPAYLFTNVIVTDPFFASDPLYTCIDGRDLQRNADELVVSMFQNKLSIPTPPPQHPLLKFQEQIVGDCIASLKTNASCQLILPCGFGKTLISWYVTCYLYPDNPIVLFLVPTCYLLGQACTVWDLEFKAHGRVNDACILRVCSERENKDGELSNVTTDERKIKKFMEQPSPVKFVFATYHSSYKLKPYKFTLAVFDEAHRTVLHRNKRLCALVTEGNIERRLFMTATPKVLKKPSEEVFSMDNEAVYGPVVCKKTIRDGIDAGALCSFEILCLAYINPNTPTACSHDAISVFMLEQVITEEKANNILVFAHEHSQVKQLEEAYTKYYPNRIVLTIINKTTPGQRQEIVNEFAESKVPIILISCRVLLEGFDVKNCDAVFFHTHKKSPVDIVQAVGRALRYQPNKVAKVIIPYIQSDVRQLNDRSSDGFKKIRDFLKVLAREDPTIVEHFNTRILVIPAQVEPRVRHHNNEAVLAKDEILQINPEVLQNSFKIELVHSELSDYEKVKRRVKPLRLRNQQAYLDICDQYALPKDPEKEFKIPGQDWKWSVFLGHEKRDFDTLEEIKAKVKAKATNWNGGVDEQRLLYEELCNSDPKVPCYPHEIYPPVTLNNLFPPQRVILPCRN